MNASAISVRGVYNMMLANLNKEDERPVVRLCRADPTDFPCFRTTQDAPDAIAKAVQSFQFNCYAPSGGLFEARRLVHSLKNVAITTHCFAPLPAIILLFVYTNSDIITNIYEL